MHTENRRTCLTYSPGGHLAEIERALEGIKFTNVYHVTFENGIVRENTYYITHPRRSIIRTIKNAIDSLVLLIKKQPKIIISTGADVTIPTIILGKLIFRCKVIYIESAGDIKPSLSGRLAYPFSDLFIVQWPEKLKYFPKATLSEGILL